MECWNCPRFTGSRRDRSCNLQGICLAPLLRFFETATVSRCARQRRGQSCNLAGICFATLFRSLWRSAPWQYVISARLSLARLPLILALALQASVSGHFYLELAAASASLVQRSNNIELRFYDEERSHLWPHSGGPPLCVCGSLGKKLAKDAREGGTEKLSRHGVVPKEGPSNGSLCRAALAFSVPELGPKIWSLQCLRQRARACFCDPYWSHF